MITRLIQDAHGIEATIDGRRVRLSWMWLRDHSRDPVSYHSSAEQRLVPPTEVASAGPGEATIRDGGRTLAVAWPSGIAADFAADWISVVGEPARTYPTLASLGEPWTGNKLAARFLEVPFGELDERFTELCRGFARDGVVVARDVPANVEATRKVLERFGYVRKTLFGDLWTFRSDDGFDDTASTPLEITPHTDGTYSNDAPGLLALHCHRYSATGGENVLVDGSALAERLRSEAPKLWDILRTTEIPGQYIGDGVHLVARRPTLRYEADRLVQISYNHHDRAPFALPEPQMSELYAALHRFDALAGSADLQFELSLRPGDMMCIDNWRLLHGRRAFSGERLIAGGYVNREDVESAMRLHGLL